MGELPDQGAGESVVNIEYCRQGATIGKGLGNGLERAKIDAAALNAEIVDFAGDDELHVKLTCQRPYLLVCILCRIQCQRTAVAEQESVACPQAALQLARPRGGEPRQIRCLKWAADGQAEYQHFLAQCKG
ncbi:hypothetical protein SDC9_183927 [bioreactor metagenome]|uniref:Uncharacterized protein n=1 Tax=bioreactor metagenome TaxID=1076179 RepID=A0A645HBK9_9ZZZZ